MAPIPTGTLRKTETGYALALSRTVTAPREDVWASLTESSRTALWFGPWERMSDDRVRVTMTFEEGEPAADMVIEACEPPQRLAVRMTDEGRWPLEVTLADKGHDTLVVLTHSLDNLDGVGDIGPGWEYYLDMLIASRDAAPLPTFDDYYPAQQEYYSSLQPS